MNETWFWSIVVLLTVLGVGFIISVLPPFMVTP